MSIKKFDKKTVETTGTILDAFLCGTEYTTRIDGLTENEAKAMLGAVYGTIGRAVNLGLYPEQLTRSKEAMYRDAVETVNKLLNVEQVRTA